MQFFNHFRKDFIRPYGLAHDENSFEHKILMRRLNSWNYKFYLHPQIAISEFTQTISQNVKYLEENIDILDQHSLTPSIKKTKRQASGSATFQKYRGDRYVYLSQILFNFCFVDILALIVN